jgi:hypothetical protein
MGSGGKRRDSGARSTPQACGAKAADGRKRRDSGARSEPKASEVNLDVLNLGTRGRDD